MRAKEFTIENDEDDAYYPMPLKLGDYRDPYNPRDHEPYDAKFKDNQSLRDMVQDLIDAGVEPAVVMISPRQLTATQDWLANARYRDSDPVFDDYDDRPVVLKYQGHFYILDGHHRSSAAFRANQKLNVYLFTAPQGVAEAINPDFYSTTPWIKSKEVNGITLTATHSDKPKKRFQPEENLVITASIDGREIGRVYMRTYSPGPVPDNLPNMDLSGEQLYVDPEYRRKGIATLMYNFVQELGNTVVPTDGVTPDGRKFWRARQKSVDENFADGKRPQDKGDSVRHGIPKKATMAELEQASHASGRKGQLARWQLNMRRGRKK
jgi:GNAT superfamily N-acetyltransferase